MSIGNRIQRLRKEMGLTQVEFCERIGLKRNSISLVESGKRNISDQAIKSICREFHVREVWLKTGEEPMKSPATINPLDQLADKHGLTLESKILIEKFLKLKPSEQKAVMAYILDVANAVKKHAPSIEEQARAEAEEYYREILQEKKAAEKLSAFSESQESSKKSTG